MAKKVNTFKEYLDDKERVTPEERALIDFDVELIGKLIEAREEKGFSQRELAELSGIKQPAIARIESLKSKPQINTLVKVLRPLGYKLTITPIREKPAGSH